MNEALNLFPHEKDPEKEPEFKDGDGGGGPPSMVVSMQIDVLDNGYVLSTLLDGSQVHPDGEIGPNTLAEVFTNTDDLIKRFTELVKS